MRRLFRWTGLLFLGVVLLLTGFVAGCQATAPASSGAERFPLLGQARDVLQQWYVEPQKLDDTTLQRGAIRGMLQALDDPYTSYLVPEDYQMELASLEGKFEGIGAYVTKKGPDLVVIAPIPGTPAEKAGIRPGDLILAVEGEPVADLSLNEAVLRIRGPRGTQVKLLILHEGERQPVTLTITRAEIPTVSLHQRREGEMGYIQIFHFTQRTTEEFQKALSDMVGSGVQGLVLDLRNNPGGLLTAVVDVADELLDEGLVLFEVDNQGQRKEWRSQDGGTATRLPIVVLVNRFSASGSEVLSGALQDRGRAIVMGEKTFGKGSVNTIHVLEDRSAIYLTSARWLTPQGRPIEGKGLAPDIAIEPPPEGTATEGDSRRDDGLAKALEYLRQGKAQPAPAVSGSR